MGKPISNKWSKQTKGGTAIPTSDKLTANQNKQKRGKRTCLHEENYPPIRTLLTIEV